MNLMKPALIALTAFASACAAQPQVAEPFDGYAIVGAEMLPMTDADRLADQTVLVSGDRIVAVGPRAKIRVPAGAKIVDGRGKYLMPGLVDMHVHLAPTEGAPGDPAQRALAVMLAHGTTTARGMAGSPQNLVVRGKIKAGALAGPRLYAASPPLNVKTVETPEAARNAVRAAKAAGFDLIKSHHIEDVTVWKAGQEEADAQKLPTAGHVSNSVGLARALAEQQQIEHLDSLIVELLPDGHPAKSSGFGQVPTLSLFETILDLEIPTERLLADPAMRFVPRDVLAQWTAQRQQLAQAGFTAEDSRRLALLRRRIAGALHRAGVPLMAGSDTAQAFHLWGPGLIKEIGALRAAGLSPMDSLRAATVVPRNYFRSLPNGGSSLGWKADFGTVEEGARADLLLLDRDPTTDLSTLMRPAMVIAAGRSFDRSVLDTMLNQAAADTVGGASPSPAAALSLPSKLFVVRHMEKAEGDDPGLTAAGAANAARLAARLKGEGIKAIFSTPYKRTMATAQPLADALGIAVTPYDPRAPQGLLDAVARAGGPVLVVGHSNTVPDLVAMLGVPKPARIDESVYGQLFVVSPAQKQVKIESLAAQ